jgi:hypothetical protein
MSLVDFLYPKLVRQIADAIPAGEAKAGCWNARRAFLSLMGLVRAQSRMSIRSMLARQFELDLFPDFTGCPSASGFSQALHLLSTADCQAAWGRAKATVDAAVSRRGPRWIAVDGSWLVTTRSRSSRLRWTTPSGGKLPQALVVTAWEVRTRLPVGFCVLPGERGERAGVDEMLPHLRAGDILLMDRGFPSERLVGALLAQDADVVMRMTTGASAWAETAAFVASGEMDAVLPVEICDPDGSRRRVPMRFIRRAFPRGRPKAAQGRELMVIATTLLDAATMKPAAIIARYDERWGVETAYREMKITFAIEHFHSPEADHIVKELYALMIWLCLAAGMAAHVHVLLEAKRGPIDPTDPCRWQINRTMLFQWADRAFWAACIPGMWMSYQDTFKRHCHELVRHAQKRRPGRSRPRERLAPFGHFVGAT